MSKLLHVLVVIVWIGNQRGAFQLKLACLHRWLLGLMRLVHDNYWKLIKPARLMLTWGEQSFSWNRVILPNRGRLAGKWLHHYWLVRGLVSWRQQELALAFVLWYLDLWKTRVIFALIHFINLWLYQIQARQLSVRLLFPAWKPVSPSSHQPDRFLRILVQVQIFIRSNCNWRVLRFPLNIRGWAYFLMSKPHPVGLMWVNWPHITGCWRWLKVDGARFIWAIE